VAADIPLTSIIENTRWVEETPAARPIENCDAVVWPGAGFASFRAVSRAAQKKAGRNFSARPQSLIFPDAPALGAITGNQL
jgi:hypothetical protein